MADLAKMRAFAADQDFGLTGMLAHDAHVVPLAQRWLPLIRFHQDERFHPVGMDGLALIPRQVFDGLTEAAQGPLEIEVSVPDVGGATVLRRFDPPVLRTDNPDGSGNLVLNEDDDTLAPFARAEVGDGAVLTHGPAFDRSNALFGSLLTLSGLPEPAPDDPREPRHPIKVIAEFRMVREALHYYLRVRAADSDEYPKSDDLLWSAMSGVSVFFGEAEQDQEPSPETFTTERMEDVLLRLLDGEANNDQAMQDAAIAAIPDGWFLRTDVLETARNCAMLEYYLIYAYNDYDEYEPWPANYHEGDDEGFCVVFDRRELEKPLEGGDLDAFFLVQPRYVITSVHEERQGADRIKDFDPISQHQVFVARGSHATYLDPGSHDFLSFGEAFEEGVGAVPLWLSILSLGSIPLLVGLLVAIGEHFRDSNDETSEDGIAAGDEDEVPPDLAGEPRFFPVEVEATPLSERRHIYQAASPPRPEEDQELGLLSYAGKLGAHSGSLGNTSPPFMRKMGRYFRKLISAGKRIT